MTLKILLEEGLWILIEGLKIQLLQQRHQERAYDPLCLFKPTVKIDCAQDGFQCICQDRGTLIPATLNLSLAQTDLTAQF